MGKTMKSRQLKRGTVDYEMKMINPITLFGFTHYKKTGSTENRPIVSHLMVDRYLLTSFWLHFGVLGQNRLKP
jgi:hypothetical protein